MGQVILMANQARKNFAQRLKALRSLHYKHASQLAELLGVEAQAYRKWEQGRAEPSIDMILKICQQLGVTPTILLLGNVVERLPDLIPAAATKPPTRRGRS